MSRSPVLYRVHPHHPGAHVWRIEMEIRTPDPQAQDLTFPAWIPGSYLMREFARNVSGLTARDEKGPMVLERVDRNRWTARGVTGALVLEYEVYAWDLSVRTSHLDQTHGYFNGTALFMVAVGLEQGEHELELLPPSDPLCEDWRVATTLARVDGGEWGFGTFRASDYDELVDHPVEMGRFDQFRFEANGIPHDVVLTGRHGTDIERLGEDLRRICEAELDFFGDPAPIDRYLFLVMVVGDGYGGLEHRSSTSLITRRSNLPASGEIELSEGYRTFMGLCSHEYFHLWNVKRITPAAFLPFDLTREAHTTLLWAFEGITSYYDDLFLARSGLITEQSFLELLGRTITRVLRTPGRFRQNVEESSLDAWTKLYKPDSNSTNVMISYYSKGALVALALDMTIRKETAGKHTLDDVMKACWA
ncbi:MAG: peptidase M61, partial [Myxococcota bacterium]|nr:peptidase M61 [Myxococcota bacterium]